VTRALLLVVALLVALTQAGLSAQNQAPTPRTADGHPDLNGVWGGGGGQGAPNFVQKGDTLVVVFQLDGADPLAAGNYFQELDRRGSERKAAAPNKPPYKPELAAKLKEMSDLQSRRDPAFYCKPEGVPRMGAPSQIVQTPGQVVLLYEGRNTFRVIPTDGRPHRDDLEPTWNGDSVGRWEGDTLVVDVSSHNDRTWFDMAGNFHSEALKVVERYTLLDTNTIQYEATIEDPKVFTRPWTIRMPLERRTDTDRIFEYQCQAEAEEANGAFERDPMTWYPGPSHPPQIPAEWTGSAAQTPARTPPAPTGAIKRMADGTPNLQGYFMADGGGANYGLGKHEVDFLTPAGRGIVVDPPDGLLPAQSWAKTEMVNRKLPERGYDDPTAHCFVAGVPRSMYVPSPMQILQPPGYLVILHERMSWRTIPLDGRPHLPDHLRLWQGDSVGRWEGDTLVIETANLNGKAWLNEVGEVLSHAARVVERLTPTDADTIHYEATVSDPLVYTRPWTIALPINRQKDELLEVACLEDDQDLPHLKDIRDAARAKKGP